MANLIFFVPKAIITPNSLLLSAISIMMVLQTPKPIIIKSKVLMNFPPPVFLQIKLTSSG